MEEYVNDYLNKMASDIIPDELRASMEKEGIDVDEFLKKRLQENLDKEEPKTEEA